MKKAIEQYNLVDFVKNIQAEIQNGWEIDFEDGESIPHSHIGYYTCKVTKGKPVAALLQPLEQPQDALINALPPDSYVKTDPALPSYLTTNAISADSTFPLHLKETREPFTPSVVFTVETPEVTQPKKVGRPKGSTI